MLMASCRWQLAKPIRSKFRQPKTGSEKPEANMPISKIVLFFATHRKDGMLWELSENKIARQPKGDAVALMTFD